MTDQPQPSDNRHDESDQTDAASDKVKPWTVRGIPPEDRNAAIAAAERQGMAIGEWLCCAIRAQVQVEAQQSRAPVPVRPVRPPSDAQSDLAEIGRLMAMAREVNGDEAPRSLRRLANAILRDRLTEIRNCRTETAASPTVQAPGPTREAEGDAHG